MTQVGPFSVMLWVAADVYLPLLVSYPGLIDLFSGEHMKITDMLTSVFPILILVGFWWFFMSRMRGTQDKQGDYIAQVKVYLTEHLAETRRMNDSLDRIARALDKKDS